MKTYTPDDLRKLADSRGVNPFWADEAQAALRFAARLLEAADAAVEAERIRAKVAFDSRRKELIYTVQSI